jgi:LL-diaminopimelate aminotransferase
MEVANRLNGIGEYYFSRKLAEIQRLNDEGKNIINLGIGSPDLPPHPEVIRVLQEESARPNVHAYQSYRGSPVLRQAIAQWYGKWYGVKLDPSTEILPLIGSKEGLMHIAMTWFEEGTEVLVPNPGYPTYSSAVKLASAKVVEYQLSSSRKWMPDLSALNRLVGNSAHKKAMIVNYPHMPTGAKADESFLKELVSFAIEKSILLIHDNPYSFILNEKPLSILSVPGALSCVIELNSLSKSHNMAGWRVGMLCGSREYVDAVLRFKSNMDSGMFLPVQLAAARALSLGEEWFIELNDVYRERRRQVFALLDELGCSYEKDQAGLFAWAAVPPEWADGYVFSDELLYNYGVFITPGGIFGNRGNGFVRVSLCSPMEKLVEATNRVMKKSGN